MKRIKKIWISLLLVFVCVFSFAIAPFDTSYTYTARAESVAEFEVNNVLDDLKNSRINGEEFTLKNYNFDATKKTQVISFLEYGYSFYKNLQGNFGLYFYVYNPKGLRFVPNSSLNSITFKIGEDDTLKYEKYPVTVLNYSQGDYNGLFYKVKVVLTEEQKQDILSKLNSTERVYCVSEIELLEEGTTNATSFAAESIYKFSGYMSGYGSDITAENTLKCNNEHLETLSLEPKVTVYRPEGTNGKNDYTQDSLHSVYFAVPNKFIESYGEMTAVHATWLNAVLKPALVTGNQEAYAAIQSYLGDTIPRAELDSSFCGYHDDDLPYMYYGAEIAGGAGSTATEYYGFGYNALNGWSGKQMLQGDHGYIVNPLYMLFNAGSGEDSADNYTVQSENIYEELKESATTYGGELVNDKYASCMFESVDSEFTEMNIRRDDEYDLTSETITQNWWQKLWGTGTVVSTTFDGIKAIYAVSDSDFTGNIEADCDNLYIGSQDYTDFKQYYEDNKTDSTVYLFRYQVSDYLEQEATLYYATKSTIAIINKETYNVEEIDTNAYFFKETVNLDFDVIDVTFSTGEKETVIPVVMSPIDVIPDATPPVYTTSDKEDIWDILMKVVYIILGLLLLIVLFPLLQGIVSIVVGFCVSVVKTIGRILSSIFDLFKKR